MIIFIAEDDISLQKSLRRILITFGHQVKVFSTGEQLLEALENSNKSELIGNCCILLDFDLPKMNGLECQNQINQINQSIPIIFMSGAADSATIIQSWRNGAKNFILKPFNLNELTSAIDKALLQDDTIQTNTAISNQIISQYKSLTPREKQVLKLVANGKTNRMIGEILGLTLRTVKMHRSNIMHKLNFDHISELVRFYDSGRDLFNEN